MKTKPLKVLGKPHFHLVGSRAVGNDTPESDWDYVASYGDKEALKTLKNLGFTKIEALSQPENKYGETKSNEYMDYNTQEVWELKSERLEVALVTSVKAKMQIIEALKFNPKLAAYDHSLKGTIDRVYLWNAFYTMYGLSPYGVQEDDNV